MRAAAAPAPTTAQTTARSVSFVVPCFNEEDNVAATVGSIREAVRGRDDFEIILVNDCSTDSTLQQMRVLAAADSHVRIIDNPMNLSLGGSYKRGIAAARCAHVIMVPGDNGFPGSSIAEILRHAGEADIVIPTIINRDVRSRFRVIASTIFTALLNWLFWLKVGYYNGAVLHRTALLRSVEIKTNSFAYQAEALVKLIARGASYTHCAVRIRDRMAGSSSALRLKNQIAVWRTILHLLFEVGLWRLRPAALGRILGSSQR